jgi:tetratricopeptide (TPR) repeat protein
MMIGKEPAETGNAISGGIFFGPVVQGRDIQATFQLPSAAPVALAQLPASVAGFTGRDGELAVLSGLLEPAGTTGAVVVSAVAGLAGVGKTTLAVAAGHAARSRGWFGGGVLFLDLHGYDDRRVDPGQALDALLRALGIPGEHIPPGVEERAGLYRSVLAQVSDPVLLIADNASSEAQVRLLLPGTGPHKVVVTSRHTLAGLDARLVDLTVLDKETAVDLLDRALRAGRPEDDRISGDFAAAEMLAAACGGLPLALQIAAALLKSDAALSAAELADDLAVERERLERLAYDDGSGASGLSVAAAFERSYRGLAEVSARVFRLLPVNPGSDVSTAAVAVLADLPVAEVRAALARLARAHLTEVAPGPIGRWRMHDLMRLYAERLSDHHAEADRREEARDRLLGYYLSMATAAGDHLEVLRGTAVPREFSDRGAALAWLDAERPNLVAAIRMAADTGRNQVALHLPLKLSFYLERRRRFDDWLATITVSLNIACTLGDRSGQGAALNRLGQILWTIRRADQAIVPQQEALAIFRGISDRRGEGSALHGLGNALREVERFDEAIATYRDALAVFRKIGDRRGEANALIGLGNTLLDVEHFDEALATYQHCLNICQEIGYRRGEGMALTNIGLTLVQLQRHDEAITTLQAASYICREIGDRNGEGMVLDAMGSALRQLRRHAEAITALQEAIAAFRESHERYLEADALNHFGTALREMQRFDEAITAYQEAANIFQEISDLASGAPRRRTGETLDNLGTALREMHRIDEAIRAHQEAANIFRETRDEHGERIALNNLETARGALQA